MQGRVELMRARRRQRRRRLVIIAAVAGATLLAVLLLWRPWVGGPGGGEPVGPLDGEVAIENGTADNVETENGEPEEDPGPRSVAELRFLFWQAGGGERALRSADYELTQLTGLDAEGLQRTVMAPALGSRLPSAVYRHGRSPLLLSFADSLVDRLGYGAAQSVDLTIILGADIRSLLDNTPTQLDATALEGLTAEVLNGCGISGVAGETSDLLRRLGVRVLTPRNYEHFDLEETRLYYSPGSFEAAFELKELLGLPGRVSPIPYDIQVILGVEG